MKFTPTQNAIMDVLRDGRRHSKCELMKCLDEFSTSNNLRVHLSHLRKRLESRGDDIVCELGRDGSYYRWVRIISYSD